MGGVLSLPAPPAPPALPALLGCDDVVSAAILLPAGFTGFAANRLFLALADDSQPAGRHAEVDQVLFDGVGSTRSEREVVLRAATRIAVPFDADLRAGPFLHPVGIPLQRAFRVLANLGLVEIEVHVAELPAHLVQRLVPEDLLLGEGTRRGRWRRGRRRRRWRWRHRSRGRRWRRWRGRRRRNFLVAAGCRHCEDQAQPQYGRKSTKSHSTPDVVESLLQLTNLIWWCQQIEPM